MYEFIWLGERFLKKNCSMLAKAFCNDLIFCFKITVSALVQQ